MCLWSLTFNLLWFEWVRSRCLRSFFFLSLMKGMKQAFANLVNFRFNEEHKKFCLLKFFHFLPLWLESWLESCFRVTYFLMWNWKGHCFQEDNGTIVSPYASDSLLIEFCISNFFQIQNPFFLSQWNSFTVGVCQMSGACFELDPWINWTGHNSETKLGQRVIWMCQKRSVRRIWIWGSTPEEKWKSDRTSLIVDASWEPP